MAPLQILLIEDNPADASMIADLLAQARAWAFELSWVGDLCAGIERLRAGGIDLVLLDLGLPESTGLATLERLRSQQLALPTVIVLSGSTDEEIAIKTLQLGAQDYLVKGQVDSAMLLRAIRYAIGRRQAEEAVTRERSRARELANEKSVSEDLRRLLDERDRMLAEREDMLRLLAHEVRQPLNNASAALESASAAIAHTSDAPAPGVRAPLARAQHVLDHVIGTLNNALAAASLLSSGAPDVSADTDLHTLVGLVVRDIAPEDRTRIVIDALTGTRTVQLHPILMRLALTNLLFNALAYSPPDSAVRLRISDSEEPLAIVFEVEDEGEGISAELLPRVFDKGTRGTHGRATSGAGLGLYIVRKVVDAHHGSIEIAANRPRGSIVRISIPQGVEV